MYRVVRSTAPLLMTEVYNNLHSAYNPFLKCFPAKKVAHRGKLTYRWAVSSLDEWNHLFALESPLTLSTV